MLRCRLLAVLLACAGPHVLCASLSKPQTAGTAVDKSNKFLRREAVRDSRAPGAAAADEEPPPEGASACPHGAWLAWKAEVHSSVYSTPLAHPLPGEPGLRLLVSTFVHSLESLVGGSGAHAGGFPALHSGLVHASPFLSPIPNSSALHAGVVTYDGAVLFFDAVSGAAARDRGYQLPHLAVALDWHKGLDDDAVEHAHPDLAEPPAAGLPPPPPATRRRRSLLQDDGGGGDGGGDASAAGAGDASGVSGGGDGATASPSGALPYGEEEASDSGAFSGSADPASWPPGTAAPREESHDGAYAGVASGARPDGWGWGGDYGGGAGVRHDYGATRAGWRPQKQDEAAEAAATAAGRVLVDPHVLCTPLVADVDGDGLDEIVIAVSYFFDKTAYAAAGARANSSGIPAAAVLSEYLATGLVALRLHDLSPLWSVHLDLSTDAAKFKALAYSSPSAADVDGDGQLEIFVGTSLGFVYSFTSRGVLRRGFPFQMGEVQASPVVADVNGDGVLEVVVGDTRGSLVALSSLTGAEVWDAHLGSMAAQAALIADVDGDGRADIVVATADGRMHALRGDTGAPLDRFPVATGSRIMAPLAPLYGGPPARSPPSVPQSPRLTLLAAAFDGRLHFIDAATGCSDAIDLGDTSYGGPLVGDIDGDGQTEVVLATMNGAVFALRTGRPAPPGADWLASPPDGNPASRGGWFSVAFSRGGRGGRDASGHTLTAAFTVTDARPRPVAASAQRAYKAVVTLRTDDGAPPVVVSATLRGSGRHALAVPTPRVRAHGVLRVEVADDAGQRVSDEVALTLHGRFARLVKWLLLAPLAAGAAATVAATAGAERFDDGGAGKGD